MSVAPAREMHWTEDEYLRMEADSAIKHEFYDGEIYAMAGARLRHNVIAANTIGALVNLLRGSPCFTFNSDQHIHVKSPGKFYTYADGGVACGPSQLSDKDGMSLENPALLFEVLSPSTRDYDRGAKLFFYQQIPSLSDVLLIDQPARLVERRRRGPRGWTSETSGEGTIAIFEGRVTIEDLYRLPPGLPDD